MRTTLTPLFWMILASMNRVSIHLLLLKQRRQLQLNGRDLETPTSIIIPPVDSMLIFYQAMTNIQYIVFLLFILKSCDPVEIIISIAFFLNFAGCLPDFNKNNIFIIHWMGSQQLTVCITLSKTLRICCKNSFFQIYGKLCGWAVSNPLIINRWYQYHK